MNIEFDKIKCIWHIETSKKETLGFLFVPLAFTITQLVISFIFPISPTSFIDSLFMTVFFDLGWIISPVMLMGVYQLPYVTALKKREKEEQ